MSLSEIIKEDIIKITSAIADDIQQLNNAAILISGGAGFIGAYFLDTFDYINKHLLKNPCKVYCIDNFSTAIPDRVRHLAENSQIQIIRDNICSPVLLEDRLDYIIHAAGIASPTFYRLHPIETIDISIKGLRILLDLAHQEHIKSFLYFSSSEVYGDPTSDNIPTPESYNGNVSCTGPRACYDESKRIGDTLCATYRKLYNMPIKTVRPGNIYGPGMDIDDKRVIPDFLGNILRGQNILILSDGKPTRCFCYITDAMIGFFKLLFSSENSEFNISNDEQEISMYGLAEEVIRIADNKDLKVNYLRSSDPEYLTDNPSRRHLDLTKARTVLGYSPKVNLHEGLSRTYAWYKENYRI